MYFGINYHTCSLSSFPEILKSLVKLISRLAVLGGVEFKSLYCIIKTSNTWALAFTVLKKNIIQIEWSIPWILVESFRRYHSIKWECFPGMAFCAKLKSPVWRYSKLNFQIPGVVNSVITLILFVIQRIKSTLLFVFVGISFSSRLDLTFFLSHVFYLTDKTFYNICRDYPIKFKLSNSLYVPHMT